MKGVLNMNALTTMVKPQKEAEKWRKVTGIDSIYLAGESRDVPWAGLATQVDEAQASDVVLKLAGLDWTVEQAPMEYRVNGLVKYTKQLVNYRSDTGADIGVVSGNYKPVNNADAFSFTDLLVDGGKAVYNAAGSLKGGRITFVSLELPIVDIMGEPHDRYIVVVADHSGKHSVRIVPTIVRVSCANTVNVALKTAERIISISHIGDIEAKMENARNALLGVEKYTNALRTTAEEMARVKVSASDARALMERLFPMPEDSVSKQRLENIERLCASFNEAYNADDLGNFRGTVWGYVQAAADLAYHRVSMRKNPLHNEGIFSQLMNGAKLLDTTFEWAQGIVWAA